MIAHRGASAAFRENTLEAFAAARSLGADMVELDVRLTADGRPAVLHDPFIRGAAAVASTKAEDLPPWLPLLPAALDACRGMAVNVEIKNIPTEPGYCADERIADVVVDALIASGWAARVVVSSFNLNTVDRVHALDPSIATAWLTAARWDQLAAVATAADRGHVALHPEAPAVTAALVDAAHDAGLAVITWTVDDLSRMIELAGAGVDGIVTNVPDVARQTLR